MVHLHQIVKSKTSCSSHDIDEKIVTATPAIDTWFRSEQTTELRNSN